MNLGELVDTLSQCKFETEDFKNYEFNVKIRSESLFVYATYDEPDINTGEMVKQSTRMWHIDKHWNKDQVVQTLFKCVLTSLEHRVREHFRYKGERVFSPHFNLDELVQYIKDRKSSCEGE